MTSTHSGGRPVDLDLLADYIEGALTPDEAARIEDLVDNDPAWAEMLAALTAALPSVDARLSAYAVETPPMPSEVAERITASLHALAADAAAPERHTTDRPATNRPATNRPAADRPAADRPGASARRHRRRLLSNRWLQAAAILIIFIGGLTVVAKLGSNSTAKSATSGNGGEKSAIAGVAPSLPDMSTRPGLSVSASGKDYNASTLTGPVPGPAFTAHLSGPTGGDVEPAAPASVPAALSRLLDPSALNDCLTAVEATNSGIASAVDFASYQGQPALIVTIGAPEIVVAAGPACGLPGRGADEIARH